MGKIRNAGAQRPGRKADRVVFSGPGAVSVHTLPSSLPPGCAGGFGLSQQETPCFFRPVRPSGKWPPSDEVMRGSVTYVKSRKQDCLRHVHHGQVGSRLATHGQSTGSVAFPQQMDLFLCFPETYFPRRLSRLSSRNTSSTQTCLVFQVGGHSLVRVLSLVTLCEDVNLLTHMPARDMSTQTSCPERVSHV